MKNHVIFTCVSIVKSMKMSIAVTKAEYGRCVFVNSVPEPEMNIPAFRTLENALYIGVCEVIEEYQSVGRLNLFKDRESVLVEQYRREDGEAELPVYRENASCPISLQLHWNQFDILAIGKSAQ